MERFIVYIPRWLRWTLLLVLSILVVGFSAAFFVGINQPGYGDWRAATVSVVQIALTGLAYVLIVFFYRIRTESGSAAKTHGVRIGDAFAADAGTHHRQSGRDRAGHCRRSQRRDRA